MYAHILTIADGLFYQQGIRAVGMDKVIAVAGIAKATLYRHFPSKEALVCAYLLQRHRLVLDGMGSALQCARETPEQQVLALFDWLEGRVALEGFRGCAFLLALGEYGHSSAVRQIVTEHKAAVLAMFEQASGLARATSDLPRQLALLYDGAVAVTTVQRERNLVALAARAARSLMAATPAGAVRTD